MDRVIRVGLLGCGVVGTGTMEILRDNAASLTRRLGAPIEVRRVVARDRDKPRGEVLGGETSREMLATATETPDLVFDHLGALTAALRSAVLAAARAPGPEAR
jgi:homoserine dehydrogenase